MKLSEMTPLQRKEIVEALTEWVRAAAEVADIGVTYLLNTDEPLYAHETLDELLSAVTAANDRAKEKIKTIGK